MERWNRRNRRLRACGAALAASLAAAIPARAVVVISSKPTENVDCAAGVCTATATKAVLNATDLANMLAASNVTLVSGASAGDIRVAAAFSWVGANRLTLDANRSIDVEAPVTVAGPGGLTLTTADGTPSGTLAFAGRGKVEFWDLHGSLVVNGTTFKLVREIKKLAQAIAQNPQGNFALAKNYDAARDGTYASSPIATLYAGTFEGLGNTIFNLTISGGGNDDSVGLFSYLSAIFLQSAVVRDLTIANEKVTYTGFDGSVGGLAGSVGLGRVIGVHVDATISAPQAIAAGILIGDAYGGKTTEEIGEIYYSSSTGSVDGGNEAIGGLVGNGNNMRIWNCHSSAAVSSPGADAGGLVGENFSDDDSAGIDLSYATGTVTTTDHGHIGGLVGYDTAPVTRSYATGTVKGGNGSTAGGLLGFVAVDGIIANSYATGAVMAGPDANVGGLVGWKRVMAAVKSSYSTGSVSGSSGFVGGAIGFDEPQIMDTDIYWDTDTSGTDQGIGTQSNTDSVAGRTTAQLQSRLPAGFDRAIWTERPNVNGGLPYLRDLPPG